MSEPYPRNGNGYGNAIRGWLPLYLFLTIQAGTGIWWMATVSADVRAIRHEQIRLDQRQEILALQLQKIDKDFAVFVAKGGRITVESRD